MGSDPQVTTFQRLIDAGLLEIGDGYRAQNDELGGDGPLFLRAGHVTDTHIDFTGVERFHSHLADRVRSKMSRLGDTIVTTKGNSTGRTAFVSSLDPTFVYSPHLSYWRSRDERRLHSGFLRYWSRSAEFVNQLAGMKASTDMAPYLSLTDQKRLKITLPPPAEQQMVGSVLGALDDKIDLNRRMNATLEAMARALFQSWFVDFDPVRAKVDGRAPAGMDAETAGLFPDRFQESGLGLIPAGWRVEPFSHHITADRGLSYKGDGLRDDETGLPMHNLNSIYEGGGYKHEGLKYYCAEYRDKHLVRAGEMIVTNTEQGFDHLLIGHAAIVPARYGADGLFSHHLYRVRPRPGSPLTPHFLVRLFNSRRWHHWISGFSNGTTINMLPPDAMELPLTVVPPPALVRVFTAFAQATLEKVEQGLQESRSLGTLRDTLLPKLLSGELSVRDASRVAEVAA
jgi:type I restriction enzyme S subunit